MSLLLCGPLGHEAFPGYVLFTFLLLKIAIKMSNQTRAGSLIALPVIETQVGDVFVILLLMLISL